ncbi:MAG: TRAP transporter small permease subunit [Alcanivoracaceae bacterium]|nr:TRAP transporter small permease subunit [Alcanivoracaceae bacterium]
MEAIACWIQRLEQFARFTGHTVSWLSLALVLLAMLIVLLRYAFDFGSIGLQEAVMYLHGALFMLGLSYTLSRDEHVRVDIFYQRFSPSRRGMVDFFGTLFLLLPTCLLMLLLSWDYVIASWWRLEGSADPGGLPLVFVLKTLLLIAPVLLVIQGTAEALRAWLRWQRPDLDAAATARAEDIQ